MIFKVSFLITFLIVSNNGAGVEKDNSFNVENVWIKSACKSTPDWLDGVQKYYNDVIVSFGSFPSEVLVDANLVISTFQSLLTKLVDFSSSKSEILSTGTTAILEAFNQVKLDDHSAQGIINEYNRMLPILMKAYREAAKDLTTLLGNELVSAVNNALGKLQCALELYMEQFIEGDANGRKVEVNFKPVLRRVQKLEDTITLNGDVKLSKHKLADPKVQDALVVLGLILDHLMVCKLGLSSSSEAVLLEQNM